MDLRSGDEPEIDLPLGHQRHHVRHPCRPQRTGDIRWIAHRAQEGRRRLITHEAYLEEAAGARRMRVARDRISKDGEPHADEHQVTVAYLARGDRNHQLLRRVATYRRNPPAPTCGAAGCEATRHRCGSDTSLDRGPASPTLESTPRSRPLV